MPRINKVLKRLITTEKSTKAKESHNRYMFEVLPAASKSLIAKEVAKKYKVEVENVNLMVIPGKKRRLAKTQRFIRLPKWKKALVQLKEGQKIEEAKDDKKVTAQKENQDNKQETKKVDKRSNKKEDVK